MTERNDKNYLYFKYDEKKGKLYVKSCNNGVYFNDEIENYPFMYFIPTSYPSKVQTEKGINLQTMYESDIKTYYNKIYKNSKDIILYGNLHPSLQFIIQNYFTKQDMILDNIEKTDQFIKNYRTKVWDIEVFEPRFKPTHLKPVSPLVLISYLDTKDEDVKVIGFKDSDETLDYYMKFKDEREMILYFLSEVLQHTDLLVGWNSKYFDTPYLFARARYLFRNDNIINQYLPFGEFQFKQEKSQFGMRDYVEIPGINEFDMIQLMKSFEKKLKSYKLGYVAQQLLGESKESYTGKISDFLKNEFTNAIKYNKKDTILPQRINKKKKYIEKALIRSFQCILNPELHDKPILQWETLLLKEYLEEFPNYLDAIFESKI